MKFLNKGYQPSYFNQLKSVLQKRVLKGEYETYPSIFAIEFIRKIATIVFVVAFKEAAYATVIPTSKIIWCLTEIYFWNIKNIVISYYEDMFYNTPQSSSSDPSLQSFGPLHLRLRSMQSLLRQENLPAPQRFGLKQDSIDASALKNTFIIMTENGTNSRNILQRKQKSK